MKEHSKLGKVLKAQLKLYEQRSKALGLFMIGAMKAKSVHLSQIANRMHKQVAPESNLRRLHRLLEEVNIEPQKLLNVVQNEAKAHGRKLKLSLDRSEWGSNGQKVNVLTLGVAYKTIALPLLVEDLNKAGGSNSDERIGILDQLLAFVVPDDIEVLTADREFASVAFLKHLSDARINFALRLTRDTLISIAGTTQAARDWFSSKKLRTFHHVEVYGVTVNIAGCRLKNGDFLIIITNLDSQEGLQLYKERWRIESLFGVLKSRGFQLELSRLTSPDKLANLVIFLGLAILWALRIAERVIAHHPTRRMPNGYPLFSLFRRGLDALRALFIEHDTRFVSWKLALKVLSCV
ncbi:MAG: transposase [Trueperaceae bacterium]